MELFEASTEQLRAELDRRQKAERNEFERNNRKIRMTCAKCGGSGQINDAFGDIRTCNRAGCYDGEVWEWLPMTHPRVIAMLDKERLEIEDAALAAAGCA